MKILLSLWIAFWLIEALPAAPAAQQIRETQREFRSLEKEIEDLEIYTRSLDELQSNLSVELLEFEESLSSRLRNIVVPLLSWPERVFTKEAGSWIEFERSQGLLTDLKSRLLREPLKMMSDRELRLGELQRLRQDIAENISTLQTKRELLNLRLEELRLIDSRERAQLPTASSAAKRRIGDIEAPLN